MGMGVFFLFYFFFAVILSMLLLLVLRRYETIEDLQMSELNKQKHHLETEIIFCLYENSTFCH